MLLDGVIRWWWRMFVFVRVAIFSCWPLYLTGRYFFFLKIEGVGRFLYTLTWQKLDYWIHFFDHFFFLFSHWRAHIYALECSNVSCLIFQTPLDDDQIFLYLQPPELSRSRVDIFRSSSWWCWGTILDSEWGLFSFLFAFVCSLSSFIRKCNWLIFTVFFFFFFSSGSLSSFLARLILAGAVEIWCGVVSGAFHALVGTGWMPAELVIVTFLTSINTSYFQGEPLVVVMGYILTRNWSHMLSICDHWRSKTWVGEWP